jgi:radical SAM superfamily enzyme YgiQ (UPF0313 family)
MVHGLILTDNTFSGNKIGIGRGSGAHRIASYLREFNYKIEVVDYCNQWSEQEFIQLCKKIVTNDTLFIGIGSNLFSDDSKVNQLILAFKKLFPNIPVILGGNNLLGRSIENVDYMIEGFAEQAILNLLDYITGKIPKNKIKFKDENFPLIDAIHDYSYQDTSNLSITYIDSDFICPDEFLGIETARGCIFKCKFCTMPLIGKKKVDYLRDVDNIIEEIEENYRKWGVHRYIINEDTLNDTVNKIELLAIAIEKLPFKLEVVCYSRLDLILAYPETIDYYKKIGIRGVHFGIETFNHQAGKLIGKGMPPEKIKQGLIWFNQQMPEVSIHCTLIVGLPGETFESCEQTQQWFASSGIECCWNFSPLYITSADKTIHTSDFSKNYTDYGLEWMTPEEIQKELEIEKTDPAVIHSKRFTHSLNDNFRKKIIFWKNSKTGENYFTAIRQALKLNMLSRKRKASSWALAEWGALGYRMQEMQTWGYDDYEIQPPWDEIEKKSKEFVNNYKLKKISFDYDNFYKDKNLKILSTAEPISINKINFVSRQQLDQHLSNLDLT